MSSFSTTKVRKRAQSVERLFWRKLIHLNVYATLCGKKLGNKLSYPCRLSFSNRFFIQKSNKTKDFSDFRTLKFIPCDLLLQP